MTENEHDFNQRLLLLSIEPLLDVLAQILRRQILQEANNQSDISPDVTDKTESDDEDVA